MRDIVLRCVECGRDGLADLTCAGCGKRYPRHPGTGIPILVGKGSRLDPAAIAARPAPARLNLERGYRHWQDGELLDWLTAAPRGKLLSFGCGDGGDRRWLEEQGFDVTAFDIYATSNADLVADGHALPFADGAFDAVTIISVLQDLSDPFRAMAEIGRVLRPGGVVIGTVAFLEPFSGGNHFNMSHLGLREVLERAGLGDIDMRPGWSSLEAVASMFWVWSHTAAGRRLSQRWNRLKYRAGLGLLRGLYRLRGKQAPEDLALRFTASLLYRATRRRGVNSVATAR